jgi:hypothetical protein
MADEADRASEFTEQWLDRSLKAAHKPIPNIVYTNCRYCHADLPPPKNTGGFCDEDCRNDFEWLQTRKAQR